MKKLLQFVVLALFCGCTVLKQVETVTPDYDVSLIRVELPANSQETFGETITQESINDTMRYVFEDDYMKIYWYVGCDRFNFTLINKSNYPIKINWDDMAFVNIEKGVSKMIHSGIEYDKRNDSQVPTTIPKGAILEDVIIPVRQPIFDEPMKGEEAVGRAKRYEDKTISVLFPVSIEDVQNNYTFVFHVDGVKAKKTTMFVHDEKAERSRTAVLIATCAGVVLVSLIWSNLAK